MSRKVGFGSEDKDATRFEGFDGASQAPKRRSPAKTIIPLVFMSVMAGFGLYITIDSLLSWNMVGFVFGFIWTVVLVTVVASKTLKKALGLDRGRTTPLPGHNWHDDAGDD